MMVQGFSVHVEKVVVFVIIIFLVFFYVLILCVNFLVVGGFWRFHRIFS